MVTILEASISTLVKNKLKFISSEANTIPSTNLFTDSTLPCPMIILIDSYKRMNIKAIFIKSFIIFHAVFIPVIPGFAGLPSPKTFTFIFTMVKEST
jgi:hypothetical protein